MPTATNPLLLALILQAVAAGTAAAAELYRCPGKDGGPPVYTDRECARTGERIGTLPERSAQTAPAQDTAADVQVEVNNEINIHNAPAATTAPRASRGLPLSVFRRLERGMSEGQVLAIAGPPERETVDSINTESGRQLKSYYYVSEGRNASVTRIQFVNGNVQRIDRDLAPY